MDGGTGAGLSPGADEPTPIPLPGGSVPSLPPIPGLTVTKTGDAQVEFGQTITYSISVTYIQPQGGTPIDKIVITDKLPANVEFVSATDPYVQTGGTIEWPLTAGTTSYTFSLVVKPTIDKIEIANTVYGRSSVADSTTGGASSNTCTQQFEGTGPCSVQKLLPYLGGDEQKAIIASMICQRESTSNPFGEKLTSGTGCNNDNKNNDDYSIGLYQINLVWHTCSEAPYAYDSSINPPLERCQYLVNEQNRSTCRVALKPVEANVQKMVSISSNGNAWTEWSTWPFVQRDLASCNINI